MTLRIYRSTDSSAPTLNGVAGSLITVLDACLVNGYGSKTAAGWTKPYSGTNIAAYQQGTGGKSMLLRVEDTIGTYAAVVGYETMSDVNTGSGPFPTASQYAAGLFALKSNNTSAREWVVVADSYRFWLITSMDSTTLQANTGGCAITYFGNFDSFLAGDAYNVCLGTATGSTISSQHTNAFEWALSSVSATPCYYAARSLSQSGQAIPMYATTDMSVGRSSGYANPTVYPDAATGGLRMARVTLHESSGKYPRGTVPGIWTIAHRQPMQSGDTFSGTGTLAGRTFIMLNAYAPFDGTVGRLAVETSDTWG